MITYLLIVVSPFSQNTLVVSFYGAVSRLQDGGFFISMIVCVFGEAALENQFLPIGV